MFKEYISLEDFYKQAETIIYDSLSFGNDKILVLEYMRSTLKTDILKSYYIVAHLTKFEASLLGSKALIIKLSMDTLIKNMLKHSELTFDNYKNLAKYINEADYRLQAADKNLIYFKFDNSIYQIVIKTTKDKQENFLTTFHKSSKQQLCKDLKRYKQIKR